MNRLLRAVIVTADVVLLGLLIDGAQVGLYAAAYRVCFLLTAIASSAHIVFQPALIRAHTDPRAASRILTDAVWMSWTLGFPLVLGGIFVAPDLLALLFGEPYREGATAFRILLGSILLLFMHGSMQSAFLARQALGLQAKIVGAAAALNIVLNLMLIPRLGITGAAVATLSAEAMILVATTATLWRWHWRPNLRELWRPSLAVVVLMALLGIMPPTVPLLVRIGAAGASYVLTLAAVGGLPPQITRLLLRRNSGDR